MIRLILGISACLLILGIIAACFYVFGKENEADTVTPVPSSDTIIPDYIKSVHQQQAACDALVITAHSMEATAEECMETLKQCTDMLKSNHLIPKRTAEKEKP